MYLQQPTMHDLFLQLGVSEKNEGEFFSQHQLQDQESVVEASFLTSQQKIILLQMRLEDAQWSELVDEMDARLHH